MRFPKARVSAALRGLTGRAERVVRSPQPALDGSTIDGEISSDGAQGPTRRVIQRRRALEMTQDGSLLCAEFTIDSMDRVEGLWMLLGPQWIEIGEVQPTSTDAMHSSYRASVDLTEVTAAATAAASRLEAEAELLSNDAATAPTANLNAEQDLAADDGEVIGTKVRFFVQVVNPTGYKRRIGRLVSPEGALETDGSEAGDVVLDTPESPVEREVRYRDPVGRYATTSVPSFVTVSTPNGSVTPYVNRDGVLSAIINAGLRPTGRIRNHGLSITNGVLRLHGSLFTRHVELAGASLVIQGRTSEYRATASTALTLDDEASCRRFGLRSYRFSVRYDFAADLAGGLLTDDVADLYIEFHPIDGSEKYKRRVGRSRFIVRARTRGGHVTRGGRTLAIEPYYTFKAKNPSLHLEVFDADVHAYLRRRLARPPGLDLAFLTGPSRPVWVVGELPYKAQDNGLHFFRHLRENHPEIDAYYVLRDDSPERRNLAGLEDHVLSYRSKKHIDKILTADRIVGSHHPEFLYPSRTPRFRRRVRGTKVFLQHGVTGAKWMVPNYGKRASGFETSLVCVCSEREKELYVTDLGYSPKEVAVTGFARFDALFRGDVPVEARQIVVMPTWRPWLQDPETFTDSDYYQRWHDLLTGAALRRLTEAHDVEVVLCLHPNMQQFSRHFAMPNVRVVIQGEVDVQHLIKSSAVMVTDYSSVAFDFAFLCKPVIYYQFDAQLFHRPHVDAQRELPGPVLTDETEVLNALQVVADDGWTMSDAYWKRARRFCAHVDQSNSERIFEAIASLETTNTVVTRVAKSEARAVATRAVRRNPRYLPTMRRLYRLYRRLPMDRDLIVFESGQGRHFSDSPRYIYEELLRRGDTRRKVWIYDRPLPIRDEHTVVVKRHSFGFYWYLARAKFWVNNHTFPHYITRRPNGQYVQTWHGTPLKRMFLDQEAWMGRDAGYKDRVTEAVAQWSVLVSPSPYTSECMRSAYDWQGPVLEVGYPRNDILLDGSSQQRAEAVRQQLGIPDHKRVVLYAPTFRDDRPTKRGRFAFDLPIDLDEWHRRFGDDHVLLIRTHVLISNKVAVPEGAESSVIDVSRHADIQELFLVSDVLVTDYSSSFFDFALLGRPIIFYAFDLENYRDNLRGFYLPYNESALPGPITTTQEDFFAAIEAAGDKEQPDPEVLEFARVYAPHDDGHASARVVDRLL